MYRLRTSVIIKHNDKLLCFIGQDPQTKEKYYFLPGGAVETGETAPECAARETLEETGYEVRIDSSLNVDKDYEFTWNGINYECTTIFYRGFLTSPFPKVAKVQDAEYHLGVQWLPLSEIKNNFNYKKEILDAILELIEK